MTAVKSKDKLVKVLFDSINSVTEAEDKIFAFCNRLDEVNESIMDIEHFIENKEITRSGAIEIVRLLKDLRLERRQIKEMWEIYNTYGKNKEKLKQKEYREFLFTEIHKTEKSLDTTYNYRRIKESYLDSLNEDKPLPRKNKKKDITYNISKKE